MTGFDAKQTYDVDDYDDAARDFWQYVALRSVERLDLRAGERVLDVPCGTGPSLLAAARLVGPDGRVTGLDYSPAMVQRAQRRVAESGLAGIDVRVGDMLAMAPPSDPFDAVLCALGVFFVDDMAGVVRDLVGLVPPGTGRVVVSVFGEQFYEPLRTTFLDAVAAVAPDIEVVEPWRRTEHEAVLQQLFDTADVETLTVTTDTDRFTLRGPSDAWRIVTGSALRHTVNLLGDAAAAEVRARCERAVPAELATTTRYAVARRRSAG